MKSDLQRTVRDLAPLGQKSPYPKNYDKNLLFPVPRADQRKAMGLLDIEWIGCDLWNAYELSCFDEFGKPLRACATFRVPANSPFLAESKSVKLYLNSLNQKVFTDFAELKALIENDLSGVCGAPIEVEINPPSLMSFDTPWGDFYCLDELPIKITEYQRNPALLSLGSEHRSDKILTHVFKAHCLVTGQPDWGSVYVHYEGQEINRESLLRYLISYHNHSGFSENCIEQIFSDILSIAKPRFLEVFGRFSRRGGIDINPYRSTKAGSIENGRLVYQ